MVNLDFLWKRGQLLGFCLVVIHIQYAVSQIDPFTTSAVQQPQSFSEIIDNIFKQGPQEPGNQQPNGLNNQSPVSPAFTHYGPEMQKNLPQSQVTDFQSMLNMMNTPQPSISNAGSTQKQPGMDELMTMMMQSFGQSATPTPEQLGFTHYGPVKQTAKPLTPEQSMMNMLMQQSQGEQNNSNMLLQYFLLMNAMEPTTSSAASSASSITSTAASVIPEATSTSAPIPVVGTSQTNVLPINGSLTPFQSNLIRTNNSNIRVSFSGISSKLGLPSNQAANQNSIRLKRLLLNRLLANNMLRLKRIRFFHDQNKETVITAANASSSGNAQLKTVPLNPTVSTTKIGPKTAKKLITIGINPQASTNSPIAPKTSTVGTSTAVTQSSAFIGQTKLSPRTQNTGRANQVTTLQNPSKIPVRNVMPRAQKTFGPIQHPVLSVTTKRPIILTTPPPSRVTIPRLHQPQTRHSVMPRGQQNSAPAAKSWRYPNYPHMATNGHHQQHQRENSAMYQNQMPYQYQNPSPMQYQPVNQAPVQNYQPLQYNNQAAPAYQSNQGHYQNVAYPNQNVANPNQNVAYPSNSVAYPNQNVAYPSNSVAYPNQNIAYPSNSVVQPEQNVAYPSNSVVQPEQNVAYPSNSVVQPNQNLANPKIGYEYHNLYPNYANQQQVGQHNGFQQPQPMLMPFPGQGRSSFPMPSNPLLAQVNPAAGPTLPVAPTIDSAEARAEYLEQNPPTERPPPVATTPAPATTTWSMPPTNANLNPIPNPLLNQKSGKQWAEVLHFLSKNFPDYMSLRSQVHQTALSSPMANQFRNSMAAKSNAAIPQSMGHGFGGAHSNQGSQWFYTTPPTMPVGEALEIEPLEVEPTPPGTTTISPIHPLHAARAAIVNGFEIAKSSNGQIWGGNFGPPIQQRQSNVKREFDMFGMLSGHNGAQSTGFHGSAHSNKHGNQRLPFFTNGHKTQNSQWGMNGAV